MYLDSSVIVKILVEEPESDFFNEALMGRPLVSSELALPEVCSALMSRERANLLKPPARRAAWAYFLGKVSETEIELQTLDLAVLQRAMHVMDRCHPHVPLRTLDAIHVASCELNLDFPLCTTDLRVRAAAEKLGIPVFPESLEEAK